MNHVEITWIKYVVFWRNYILLKFYLKKKNDILYVATNTITNIALWVSFFSVYVKNESVSL